MIWPSGRSALWTGTKIFARALMRVDPTNHDRENLGNPFGDARREVDAWLQERAAAAQRAGQEGYSYQLEYELRQARQAFEAALGRVFPTT